LYGVDIPDFLRHLWHHLHHPNQIETSAGKRLHGERPRPKEGQLSQSVLAHSSHRSRMAGLILIVAVLTSGAVFAGSTAEAQASPTASRTRKSSDWRHF
jgi:hypothetical protein